MAIGKRRAFSDADIWNVDEIVLSSSGTNRRADVALAIGPQIPAEINDAEVDQGTVRPPIQRECKDMAIATTLPEEELQRVPDLKAGVYADGLPLHEVQYLQCKLILRPNKFDSRKRLFDFAKVLRKPAAEHKVSFSSGSFIDAPLKIREVLFIDTPDFRFYNNGFILRRRIPYADGFPIGDPEVVFKFRCPDMQKAAETDVRPQTYGDYRIKFKCEALPLKDRLGGIRRLFSHNVQFPLSHVHEDNRASMDTIMRIFPVLERLRKEPGEKVEIVSSTIVEEVLQDIGIIDFGNRMSAKANVALWRARGDHRPLIGEFAFQFKFKRREDLREATIRKAAEFFRSLQYAAQDWISLASTKTGVVYGLHGIPRSAHE